ncbi:hypothetical protein ACJMK2_036921 [Sinanodonta woodiana]|uniref:Uncharacterized protein n=1 Tax=Sinanodonta woodiana TaxID=1069815 RepID=A0ABD3WKH2_SINWO
MLHFVGGNGPSEQHSTLCQRLNCLVSVYIYVYIKPPKERDITSWTTKQLKLDTQDIVQELLGLVCSPGMSCADVDSSRQLDAIALVTSYHDNKSTCDSGFVTEMPCKQNVECQTKIYKDTHDLSFKNREQIVMK